jgi:hypothetical protein
MMSESLITMEGRNMASSWIMRLRRISNEHSTAVGLPYDHSQILLKCDTMDPKSIFSTRIQRLMVTRAKGHVLMLTESYKDG